MERTQHHLPGLLASLDSNVGDGIWLGIAAVVLAILIATIVVHLLRRIGYLERRLETVEARKAASQSPASDKSINAFCQQLMTALQMEVPAAVSSKMSADDPARFARVLAIYTRAQRRKLVTLYNHAETLREQIQFEETRSAPSGGPHCVRFARNPPSTQVPVSAGV